MTQNTLWLLVFGLAGFFILHSFLASIYIKQKLQGLPAFIVQYYRLFYNILAIALFLPLVVFMRSHLGPVLWTWSPPYSFITDGLAVSALLAFLWTLKGYDMLEFLGIRQIFSKNVSAYDQGTMHISTPHRFVRHPWYTFILVILWSRDIHLAQFITYSLATAYFVIGSRLEEKKLIVYYGEAYRQYMQKVPGLIPLPGHYINTQQAQTLIALSRKEN